MPPDAPVVPVVERYRAVTDAQRARVVAYLEALWNGLPDYRDESIDRFVATIIPAMAGAQRQAATAADAYLAAVETAALGVRTAPLGVPAEVVTTEALRGVPAAEVYRRPAVTVYKALSDGLDPVAAGQRGLTRATEIVETDLQLAGTHATRNILARKPNVVGYRRAPRSSGACKLCLTAATQRYHRSKLLPIHTRCHCQVLPIYGHKDPGQKIALQHAPDDVDVVEHHHGEIGPVLGQADHAFTGPKDL